MSRKSNLPDEPLYNKIIETYLKTQSVKKTSEQTGVSEVTARRVLITEGLWSSPTSQKIAQLINQGMSVGEISEEMGVTVNAVQAYLPYSRGMYGNENSEDSEHSRSYRERVNNAQEGVRNLTGDKNAVENAEVFTEEFAESDEEPVIAEERSKVNNQGFKANDSRKGLMFRLHLQLVGSYWSGCDVNLGLDDKERQQLFSLAKAEQGISRDIIVPADMNLHALHYAIQKLFGWQNSHLHHFALSEGDFEKVTNGLLKEYVNLCGSLFRFPDGDLCDICWDDDYQEDVSPKNWLKSKYTAPYRCGSVGDSWLGNQWKLDDLWDKFPDFNEKGYTLERVNDETLMEEDFNYLLERLTIGELFVTNPDSRISVQDWKKIVESRIDALIQYLDDTNVDEDFWLSAADELKKWRDSYDALDHYRWTHPASYRSDIKNMLGESYEDAVRNHKERISFWTDICMRLIRDWNIEMEPFFSELYYLYDYGDDWCIKITLEGIYRILYGEVSENAVCIAADGMNLVDDCGGINGYLDMLKAIYGRNKKRSDEMKEWAGSLGWSGRMNRPENML